MSETHSPKDIWQNRLEQNILTLKKCQEEKNVQSCLKCTQVLECSTRKAYVKSVYESMNKGQGGEFEF
ncbi:hypothetical protein BKH42_04635 [Helicobacter sp. 13S00482-2]|uniref:hypothetical protein n=1 Tax=Helicobacter sp. 13S00482-2 TaxID=1476200 RepID=UPI000BA6ECFD|nr:hypothetical protein [Helicobacter sp. 13S00482-2]PAF53782.1 hypothetical protein BKH42_04635 [Helicobacter sp. 13S00482-2]